MELKKIINPEMKSMGQLIWQLILHYPLEKGTNLSEETIEKVVKKVNPKVAYDFESFVRFTKDAREDSTPIYAPSINKYT